jgi:hypothetical protein
MTDVQNQDAAPPPAPADQPAAAVPGLSAEQLALYAGWTMAVLYGSIPARPAGRPPELPTVHELDPGPRRNLELTRLRHLLTGLLPGFASMRYLDQIPTGDAPEDEQLRTSTLALLNVAIMTALTGASAEVQLAYELGRSLRDTANPPANQPAGPQPAAADQPAQPAQPASQPAQRPDAAAEPTLAEIDVVEVDLEEYGRGHVDLVEVDVVEVDLTEAPAAPEPPAATEAAIADEPQERADAPQQHAGPTRQAADPPRQAAGPAHHAVQDPVAYQLSHQRIAQLQEWLAILSDKFPDLTTAVVAGSLGRWSDFAAVTLGTEAGTRPASGGPKPVAGQTPVGNSMRSYLLPQGDVWLMLLIGEEATSGLLTPEGYVAAGEAALHRSGVIVRGVIRHYWGAFLVMGAALAGVLYLSLTYLGGASQVWTSIAAIGGCLGVSAQTVVSRSSRLAAEAGKPVFQMSEEDAMAWAITTLPPASLSFRGVRRLRRAGIPPTASLGRI